MEDRERENLISLSLRVVGGMDKVWEEEYRAIRAISSGREPANV